MSPATPLDESQQLLQTPQESSTNYLTPDGVSAISTTKSSTQEIPRKFVTTPTTSTGRIWRTGIFRNVPWMGLSSLLVALLSTAASAIVLAASDQQPVASWSVSPHVMLAILSVVTLSCLKLSLSSGVTVTWWHHVLNGAPLADTHRSWDFGNSIWAAATAGKNFNIISLATILVAIAMVEGPIIQKASIVSTRQVSKPISILASLAPNLPSGYTAVAIGHSYWPTMPTAEFSEVFSNYSTRATIQGGFQGCPGSCQASVPGVGFKVDCQSYNTSFSMDGYGQNPFISTPQFMVNTTWGASEPENETQAIGEGYESLGLSSGWAVNTGSLSFVNRVCNLSLAIVSYPLTFENTTVTFSLPPRTNPDVLSDLSTPFGSGENNLDPGTTLGGFYLLGSGGGGFTDSGPFYANVSMNTNGAHGIYSLFGLNSFSWSHSDNPVWDVYNYEGYSWLDPTADILAAYHEIMFRLAMKVATNATLVAPIVSNGVNYASVKNVTATYTFAENYYESNFVYLAGAMGVIVLAILGVLPTFRGWWEIGRPTTLSPLETAKAFGAPLLAEYNSNEKAEDLIKSIENKKVQYGIMRWRGEWDSEITLRLAEVGMFRTSVRKPLSISAAAQSLAVAMFVFKRMTLPPQKLSHNIVPGFGVTLSTIVYVSDPFSSA
ncbi:uncharacterized protein PAC_18251 [Phialocephala subalpina]|uniref:Uncharacterized protein n=1 Tax=Phialocephala subalpina TaxID=576137 RepID=A0A1L7XTK2_9HELO|nr:uncharacterized protein PAC_18251 [Phialocephala subalpina]